MGISLKLSKRRHACQVGRGKRRKCGKEERKQTEENKSRGLF